MEKLRLSHKAWKKFPLDAQEALCKKFHVILTDYRTRNEKIIDVLAKLDITRPEFWVLFDKYFNKVDNGFKKFDDAMEEFDRKWQAAFPAATKKTKLIGLDDIKI